MDQALAFAIVVVVLYAIYILVILRGGRREKNNEEYKAWEKKHGVNRVKRREKW